MRSPSVQASPLDCRGLPGARIPALGHLCHSCQSEHQGDADGSAHAWTEAEDARPRLAEGHPRRSHGFAVQRRGSVQADSGRGCHCLRITVRSTPRTTSETDPALGRHTERRLRRRTAHGTGRNRLSMGALSRTWEVSAAAIAFRINTPATATPRRPSEKADDWPPELLKRVRTTGASTSTNYAAYVQKRNYQSTTNIPASTLSPQMHT